MRTLAIIALAIFTLTTSCSRTCGTDDGQATFTGKWKYIAYYMDPGDGSGDWGPVPAGQTYVDFRIDKSIDTDIPSLTQYHSYDTQGDSLITFYSNNNSPIIMGLKLKGNILEILPPCFEGCGLRFKK